MQALLDILLPPRCALCTSPRDALCPDCLAGLPYLAGPSCTRCGRPTALPVDECRECGGRRLAFQRAAAAMAYEGGGRELVRHLKGGRRRALAGRLARWSRPCSAQVGARSYAGFRRLVADDRARMPSG